MRVALIAALIVLVVSVAYIFSYRKSENASNRAVIIDGIASTDPNPTFTSNVTRLLEAAGMKVDVLEGREVTVDALKHLPEGYRVVLFRVHSTTYHNSVWIFTGEEYDPNKYILEQLSDEVHKAKPAFGAPYVFAVGVDFVLHFMKGKFRDSLVLMMGCDGLKYNDLAKVLVDQGASAYVSWDGPISLNHTDNAFLSLLEGLCAQRLTIAESVHYSEQMVGRDPSYNCTLSFFPVDVGSFKLG